MENVKNGKVESLDADVIMVCVGRRPYTETLGLETCGIEVNERGQVPVDDNFKVSLWFLTVINSIFRPPVHPSTPLVTSSEALCWPTRPKTKVSSVLNILLAKVKPKTYQFTPFQKPCFFRCITSLWPLMSVGQSVMVGLS